LAAFSDLLTLFGPIVTESNHLQLSERQFTDGTTRPVYRHDDGRQFVLDDGEPVYGIWPTPTNAKNRL
jgi:hypothetical protein